MKEALDVVMAWQLRNPNNTDRAGAIKAVEASRSEQNESELPLRLASHFLQLTIPPFFPQNKPTSNALEASRQPAPWKDAGNRYVLDLLAWSIRVLDRKTVEAKWQFLMPPVLKMMDDIDVEWKAKGCHMLSLILGVLRQPLSSSSSQKATAQRSNSASFLLRSGYHNIFAEALMPMFTHLPSITPEKDSVTLFRAVYPALILLALLVYEESGKADSKELFLDRILREGILSPLGHFPTPSMYPELATLIMSQVPVVLNHMGIDTVKHLPDLVPLLSAILQEPFALSHQALVASALEALQSVMLNAWPRIAGHRGDMMMGLCLVWSRCLEEERKSGSEPVEKVKTQVKETVAMLDAVMQSVDEIGMVETWRREKQDLVGAQAGFEDMFGECVEQVRSNEMDAS